MEKKLEIADLYTLFHEDALLNGVLKEYGQDIQDGLATYFEAGMKLESRPLQEKDSSTIYDPTLPTIAVNHQDTFGGVELFGLAAYEDGSRANVIYVPAVTKSLEIAHDANTGDSYLQATSGALIAPTGQVLYGTFPQAIRVDAFETGDHALLRQCKEHGIPTFQDADAVEVFRNKANLHEFVTNKHTRLARRIARSIFMNMSALEGDIVIKPSDYQGGIGVRIINEEYGIEQARNIYGYLERYGYSPLVEERVQCIELTDPETGEQLDWNARAILSYGQLIDMYIRADTVGKPVNICISARKIKMSDFSRYVDNRETADRIVDKLTIAARAVAEENPYSIVGIDLTVDNDMQAYMYEMDSYVGGMQTIATLEDTYDGKLAMARTILAEYIRRTSVGTPVDFEHGVTMSPLVPTFKKLIEAVVQSKFADRVAELSLDDLPAYTYQRYGRFQVLAAMRDEAYYRTDEAKVRQIDEVMRALHPLEVREFLDFFCYYSYEYSYWKDFLDEYLALYDPKDEMALSYREKLDDYEKHTD